MGLMVATKAFFKLLTNQALSESFDDFASGNLALPAIEVAESKQDSTRTKPEPTSGRSDAISLLSALQREARFLDLVNESLDGYSDEQIGGAARDVIRDCGSVIERMFALQPMTSVQDGESLKTPAEFDPAEYRLTGNVTGDAPFSGTLAHHGWKATKCDVPKYSGSKTSAKIVAPIELEIK
jgi:hypothetical protein